MKRTLYILTLTVAGALLSSCIGDLNTKPLNKTDFIADNVYDDQEITYLQGLSKIYFQFVSNDTKDLEVADGGASELIRAFWSAQETTTDEAKCAWIKDAWVRALNTNTYSEAQNDATYAVYVRTIQGITLVNEYLRQTAPELLRQRGVSEALAKKIDGFRAEARFLRAYFYWMAMDTFGDVPFTTEEDELGMDYKPKQKPRKDIFNYVTGELEALLADGSDMPAAQSNYPRADKGSVAGLLVRLYLNAEVYTAPGDKPGQGTAEWSKVQATCEKVFNMGYALCPKYSDLFRGDNGENDEARGEFLFAAAYDAQYTKSYGGTTYLLVASLESDEVSDSSMPTGVNAGWAGLRMPYEFIKTFFRPLTTPDYNSGSYLIGDNRADSLFFIEGRKESMNNDKLYDFKHGWVCRKFNNVPHGIKPEDYLEEAKNKAYSDVDFPLIRLGEIYLAYAEACVKLGETSKALPYIKEIQKRAIPEFDEATVTETLVTEDWLRKERARELYWEGHRRTDLIRYGLYHSDKYKWPYKGSDAFTGKSFPEYMTVFAIPPTELAANDALYQNYGYPTTK
ncbi:MAG: RagB/SusD family nutrient uptake outer membrane protein [Bacteroidales bacterium]|nr:RagB/SusD family nutrient uptake outer membrane protein [Bacteroidales bacterium]